VNLETPSSLINDLIDRTFAASLGTLLPSGTPFVSLVNFSRHDKMHLVMLLSGLAQHTRNLRGDNRCSLLVVGESKPGIDPLAAHRVSLTGQATKLERGTDGPERECMLKRHPGAAMYAELGDFAIYRFEITEAHLVAGFGRIQTILASQLE